MRNTVRQDAGSTVDIADLIYRGDTGGIRQIRADIASGNSCRQDYTAICKLCPRCNEIAQDIDVIAGAGREVCLRIGKRNVPAANGGRGANLKAVE